MVIITNYGINQIEKSKLVLITKNKNLLISLLYLMVLQFCTFCIVKSWLQYLKIAEEKNGWCQWYNSSTTKILFFNTNASFFFYCKQIVILLIILWITCICVKSSIFLSFRACLPWWWVTFIFSSMCLPDIPFVWHGLFDMH